MLIFIITPRFLFVKAVYSDFLRNKERINRFMHLQNNYGKSFTRFVTSVTDILTKF